MGGYSRRLLRDWPPDMVLLTPTLTRLPAPIGHDAQPGVTTDAGRFSAFLRIWNITGQPAISLPLHETSAGIPVGVQLVGPPGRDDLLIGAGGAVSRPPPAGSRGPRRRSRRTPEAIAYHCHEPAQTARLVRAMKTYVAKPTDRERNWLLVDADGRTLGRLATQIADALRGKRKPTYTPHIDTGDFVIVVNAEKISVTGDKLSAKRYYRHSGYPGGLRSRSLAEHARAPTRKRSSGSRSKA